MSYTSHTEVTYYGSVQCPGCRNCFLAKGDGGERYCSRCGISYPTTY